MAIVNLKSTIFGSYGVDGSYIAPDGGQRDGAIHHVAGSVSNAADDSSGSTYLLCTVPASFILLPESLLDAEGWGFAQTVLGITGAADGLLDAATSGLSASGDAIVARFGSDWNKPIWEQAGLAADPLVPVDIMLTAEANAAGAGIAHFDFRFANHI